MTPLNGGTCVVAFKQVPILRLVHHCLVLVLVAHFSLGCHGFPAPEGDLINLDKVSCVFVALIAISSEVERCHVVLSTLPKGSHWRCPEWELNLASHRDGSLGLLMVDKDHYGFILTLH